MITVIAIGAIACAAVLFILGRLFIIAIGNAADTMEHWDD